MALDDIYIDMEYMNKSEFESIKFVINRSNNRRMLRIKKNNEITKFHSCTESKIHFNKEN